VFKVFEVLGHSSITAFWLCLGLHFLRGATPHSKKGGPGIEIHTGIDCAQAGSNGSIFVESVYTIVGTAFIQPAGQHDL
jgi:hypothetical protein